MSGSIQPLSGRIQWLGLKYASAQTLRNIEQLPERDGLPPYVMWRYFEQKYAALGNAILMRLARQIFLFFQAPFFGVAEHNDHLVRASARIQNIPELCRRQNWPELQRRTDSYHGELCASLQDFYRERITLPSPEEQIPLR